MGPVHGNWPTAIPNKGLQWNTWVNGTLLSASSSYWPIPKNVNTIPQVASWNSEGEGSFLHVHWNSEGMGGNAVWNFKHMGGFSFEFPAGEDSKSSKASLEITDLMIF